MELSESLNHSQRILYRSLLVLSLFELILAGATWPVWSLRSSVPCIPLLAAGGHLPHWFDSAVLVVFLTAVVMVAVSSLFAVCVRRSSARVQAVFSVSCGTALLTGIVLAIASTHRLQAWHVLYLESLLVVVVSGFVVSGFRALMPVDRQVAILRLLPATIYVCSALSRCSSGMSDSMTAQVVRVLLELAGLSLAAKSSAVVSSLAWFFALGELLIGLGLLAARARRWFVGFALLLHIILIAALGPWGLNHHHGVLLWNGCFLCLIPAIFGMPGRAPIGDVRNGDAQRGDVRKGGLEKIAIGGIIVFPLSGLFGLADNWPGWQLYSSRPEVWRLYVQESSAAELPKDLQPFVGPPQPLDDWCPVRLDRWVLSQTNAPLYPEDRYQLGLILEVTHRLPDDHIKILVDQPGWWDYWNREFRVIQGRKALELESRPFLLNARAANSENGQR